MRIYIRRPSITGWKILMLIFIYLTVCGTYYHWNPWIAIPFLLGFILCTTELDEQQNRESFKRT
jgi:hypothetical protein